MIRDKLRSETEFGRPRSLRGSVAIWKMARTLGVLWPRRAHLIGLQRDVGGGREPEGELSPRKPHPLLLFPRGAKQSLSNGICSENHFLLRCEAPQREPDTLGGLVHRHSQRKQDV